MVAVNTNDNIIGTLSGHVFEKPAVELSKVGVVYNLWVNSDSKQQGVGQALPSTLEAALIDKGAQAFQVGWNTGSTMVATTGVLLLRSHRE